MIVSKNLIFLGMPGSGKGTISSHLQKEANIFQISTGDIFREEIKKETELGLKVKELVSSGKYVPDDITNEIVKKKINFFEKEHKKFILDGYPRTVEQAKFLDSLAISNYEVVYLDIDVEEVIQRLSQRLYCSTCKKTYNLKEFKSKKHPYCENDETFLIQREDDKQEAVKKRLDVYIKETNPLIDFYKQKNKLISIKAKSNIVDLVKKILDIIK